MADVPRTRRSALRTLGLAALGGAGLWRYLTPRETTAAAGSDVMRIREDEVPADGALVLPEDGVAVVRRGVELFAIDLACTHLGCTVAATESGFACPCHGSRFGSGGEVLGGPAPRSLARLAVESREGTLLVPRGRGAGARASSSAVAGGCGCGGKRPEPGGEPA
jgi:nitrite reductase/ring-hydroxylating ferredoxin subunit